MKRGTFIAAFAASMFFTLALVGCGEEEEKKNQTSKEVDAAAKELADDLSTSGWEWLYRPFTVSGQAIADAWRRDYTKTSVNPADGSRGGPTYETLPCIAMYLEPTAGDVNNGTAHMLVVNTNEKSIECVGVKYAMHEPADSPQEKCTIRVTSGTNARGLKLDGRFYQGLMVSQPVTWEQAARYTELLRSKYNVEIEKSVATSAEQDTAK